MPAISMIAAIDELIAARERSPMVNRSALKARFEILTLAAGRLLKSAKFVLKSAKFSHVVERDCFLPKCLGCY